MNVGFLCGFSIDPSRDVKPNLSPVRICCPLESAAANLGQFFENKTILCNLCVSGADFTSPQGLNSVRVQSAPILSGDRIGALHSYFVLLSGKRGLILLKQLAGRDLEGIRHRKQRFQRDGLDEAWCLHLRQVSRTDADAFGELLLCHAIFLTVVGNLKSDFNISLFISVHGIHLKTIVSA